MAPEQWKGGADVRADLYGLGVTLYEMLTGRLPFNPVDENGDMKAPEAYMIEICRGEARSPEEYGVDSELSAIVLKAMDCRARNRFQSALEMQQALQDILRRLSPEDAIADAKKETDPARRERELRKVVERFPRYPQAYRELAWCYSGQARPKDAVRALEEGRRKCEDRDGELLVDLATCYNQLGMHKKAADALEAALGCQLSRKMRQNVERLLQVTRRRGG
jgi:tetratricopeptide (TPR) repeat protein